jgi:hypothetical protein
MYTVFLVCALIGGTVMVCQFVMTVMGIGGDVDLPDDVPTGDLHVGGDVHAGGLDSNSDWGDVDSSHHHAAHGSNWFFVKLTFQTVVAALAFFGLGGLAAAGKGASTPMSLVVAIASGVAALYIVYWLMELIHRFDSKGNVEIGNAVGRQATVYVSIPAEGAGVGKIMLNLQNRTVELPAQTSEPQKLLPGATVVVLEILGPNLVEVAAIAKPVEAESSS